MRSLCTAAVCLVSLAPVIRAEDADQQATEHFEKHVRPVLVEKCVSCHGPKKQESGLRLDSRAGALTGGEIGGPVIDPQNPSASSLLSAIRSDGDVAMPPNDRLKPEQIRAIEIWLKSGAPWPGSVSQSGAPTPEAAWKTHWAAQPIRVQQPPVVKQTDRVYTPVDAFVLHHLEKRGLTPSPVADARTLIRRTHFVLTGLPPTAEQVEDFATQFAVRPQQAMSNLVERLLQSPHYGERWARHWLDVARYADTRGYVRLQEQPNYYYAYTYRDYVIDAFHSDLPYDQFVREQLAADLLITDDDNRRLAALGFLTLGRRFTGNQHDIIDDRIDVVSRGLMGLTMTCARCHNHKFDPIPTDDYYALYGVFASTVEPSDLPYLGSSASRPVFNGDMAVYREKRKVLDDQIRHLLPPTLDMLRADTTRYLHGVLAGRREFLVPLPAAKGELRQTFVERWVEYLEGTARGEHPVFAVWHTLRRLPAEGFSSAATNIIKQSNGNTLIRSALKQAAPESMSDVARAYGQVLTDVHRKWLTAKEAAPDITSLPNEDEEQLRQVLYGDDSPFAMTPRETLEAYLLDAEQNRDLAQAYLTFDAWLAGTGLAPDRAHVLYESGRIHEPHVFIRGNPERTGRRVSRRAPGLLGPQLAAPFAQGSGRLELANAIVSPDNPLTARVIVNRVWTHLFGSGLVGTPSNFGLRSDPPTHPRLLDYLAFRFMSEGWSIKKLQRWILLSGTWQQTSVDRPPLRSIDPENRLLWRANRRRMDFETLRDTLLAVAGRLDTTIGGRPIPLNDPGNVRRTIYGHINRSSLPSILSLFDFPSPDTHSPLRPKTTAPQQALYLMNSSFVMQQAGAVTESILTTPGIEPKNIPSQLYRTVIGRPTSSDETTRCLSYVENGGEWKELVQALIVSNEFLFID